MPGMCRTSAIVLAAWLVLPPAADAKLCDVLPLRCTYEGAPFTLSVLDAGTQRPLADVHALAEWQLHGRHGANGPLMVQDAVSGPDGVLRFPAWGPVRGPRAGLVGLYDPIVTLFKPGYRALVIYNDPAHLPDDDNARVRRFGQDGATFTLAPFRGTPDEWVAELAKVARAYAAPMSDETRLRFRDPYRTRLRKVWAERETLPERFRARGQLFWSLEATLNLLEKGRR